MKRLLLLLALIPALALAGSWTKNHLGYIPADDTHEVRDLGLDFPIAVWGEIEECYDYERSRNYFQGLVYIDVPS